ncbi:MAG: hypothetical protein U0987_06570, partial [Afipia sp.]|nr:hypothetical protein [Afipia sp.]
FDDLPEFNNHALLLSLDAKAQEIGTAEQIVSNRLNTELAKAIASRTISLAIVAIIIAAVAILIQPRVRPEDATEFPLLWKTSTFAADNFFHFLGLTVVIVLVTWATTAFNLRLNNQQIGRSILEASYVKKRPAIAVFSLGTAVLFVITVWLFWPAVASLIETGKDFIKLFR